MQLAERSNDTTELMIANFALAEVLMFTGEAARATDHFKKTIEIYDPVHHPALAFSYSMEFGVGSHLLLTLNLLGLGFPDQALNLVKKTVEEARNRQPTSMAASLWISSIVAMYRGDVGGALSKAEECMALSRKYGFHQYVALSSVISGWALAHSDRGAEGVARVRDGIAGERRRIDLWLPGHLAVLAEACVASGRPDEAITAANEALETIERMGEVSSASTILKIKADALLAQNPSNAAAAEECYLEALRVARAQEARGLELRVSIRLANFWKSQAKAVEARDILAPIYGWFTEGFDTADLKEAKALLDELR
jgi:tetratricopeptide (TPR) repeat protein